MTKENYVEYFNYLDKLRDSGETNMFGSGPYLTEEFGLGRSEARQIAMKWMDTYSDDSVEDRAEKALQ